MEPEMKLQRRPWIDLETGCSWWRVFLCNMLDGSHLNSTEERKDACQDLTKGSMEVIS